MAWLNLKAEISETFRLLTPDPLDAWALEKGHIKWLARRRELYQFRLAHFQAKGREYRKTYFHSHRELERARAKARRAKNPRKELERARAKAYRERNRKKYNAKARARYLERKEFEQARAKAYREKNRKKERT